jgi:hypothetical protein
MSEARRRSDRRLGFALSLLLVAMGAHNCVRADEPEATCHPSTIYVRDGQVTGCVDGVLEPLIPLSESERKAGRFAQRAAVGGVLLGLAFGHGLRRRKK